MEYFRNDVKSGAFVMIAFVLFIFAVFKIGGIWDKLGDHRQITMNFENSQQVDDGTPVLFRGKKIGRVAGVEFVGEGNSVNVICEINPNTKLYAGTMARISDKSALGGKIIELIPPALQPGETYKPMDDKDVIGGMPPTGLAATVETINAMIQENRQKIKDILVHLDDAVLAVKAQVESVGGTVRDTGKAVETQVNSIGPKVTETLDRYKKLADELIASVDDVIARIEPKVTGTLDETTATMKEYRELAVQLKADVSEVKEHVNQALNSTTNLMVDADSLIVNNYEEISSSIASLDKTLRNFELFSDKIAENPSMLVWGKGDAETVAPLSDEEIFNRQLRGSGHIGRKSLETGAELKAGLKRD